MKLSEEQLKARIEKMVRESLDFMMDETKKKKNTTHSSSGERKKSIKRRIVLKWLKDDSTNCAAIMRELWNPETQEEEDAKRSYFYKCRDGVLNDSGQPYQFTDADVNKLYSIKSNT